MQHLLQASAYADQLAHCALDGVCYAKNDDFRAFAGTVEVEVTDLKTGKRHVVSSTPISLAGGPAVTRWFCATPNASNVPAVSAAGRSGFRRFASLIPTDRVNYTKPPSSGSLAACEKICSSRPSCVGFTRANGPAPTATATCYMCECASSFVRGFRVATLLDGRWLLNR